MDVETKERVFQEFNTLSIVFKQPSHKFVLNKLAVPVVTRMEPPPAPSSNPVDDFDDMPVPASTPSAPPVGADLLGEALDAGPAKPPPPPQAPAAAAVDLLGMGDL